MPPMTKAGRRRSSRARPRTMILGRFLACLGLAGAAVLDAAEAPNTLTPAEARAGWRLLWDGRTSRGWRGANLDGFPATGWIMKDGTLTIPAAGGIQGASGGDIVTLETFSDFELSIDFRIAPDAKSGVKYFVDPDAPRGPATSLGLQYHIVDDAVNPDARKGTGGDRTLGSVYDLVPADPHKTTEPTGAWNTLRIVARGGRVEHWLNGGKVLAYDRFSPEFRARLAASKYKDLPGFGQARTGRILLQDHGHEVSFRNLKIRVLPPEPQG